MFLIKPKLKFGFHKHSQTTIDVESSLVRGVKKSAKKP